MTRNFLPSYFKYLPTNLVDYGRITERLETPIALNDTEASATTKQEPIEPVKAVTVSQPVITTETKSSLSMVSDQVD